MGIPAGEPDEIFLQLKISIVAIIAITFLLETEKFCGDCLFDPRLKVIRNQT